MTAQPPSIICPECGTVTSKDVEGYIRPHQARIVYGDPPYRSKITTCPGSRTFHFEGQPSSSIRAIPTPPPGSGKKRK